MEIDGSGINRPTFSGLATGIDTSLLIEGLITIQRRPLQLLQDRRDDLATQQSAFREFNGKLLALRDAARALDNRISTLGSESVEEEFLSFAAESSDEEVVKAAASGLASAGDYDVRVTQLATLGRDISQGFASKTDVIAAEGETLTIDFANPDLTDITLTVQAGSGGASLQELRDGINLDAANEGSINAEILFDGSEYRLVISGTGTGAENAFAVSGTGATLGAPGFIDAALHQDATDAALQVLGVAVTSASNTVEEALPGVILELRGTNTGVNPGDADYSESVRVAIDEEDVEEKLQAFVDAFNEVASFIDGQFDFDETSETTGGPLSNDFLLRRMQGQIRGVVSDIYLSTAAPLTPFSTLSSIGVAFGSDGRLALDSADFQEALLSNPRAVRGLLSGDPDLDASGGEGAGDGVATALARFLEPIVRFGDGTLALREESFQRQIDGFDDSIERFEARLLQREESLLRRFSALEASISALQAQSLFFGSIR